MLSQKNIENNTVQQKQLENITEGDESLFYDFIDGPWFNGDNIIAFSPDDVITSYSIHYTKLYEAAGMAAPCPASRSAVGAGDRDGSSALASG